MEATVGINSKKKQPIIGHNTIGKRSVGKLEKTIFDYIRKNPVEIEEYYEMFRYPKEEGEQIGNLLKARAHREIRERLKKLKNHSDSFDIHTIENDPNRLGILNLINLLPASVLNQEFGRDMVVWNWINSEASPEDDSFSKVLRKSGIDLTLLEKAVKSCKVALRNALGVDWSYYVRPRFNMVVPLYELMTRMDSFVSSIDAKNILAKNAKFRLSEGKISKYSFSSLISRGSEMEGDDRHWYPRFHVHVDGPVGIGLLYTGKPQAGCSFNVSEAGTLCIYQIQGVRPKAKEGGESKFAGGSRGLFALDWQKALVDTCEEIAKAAGFSRIGIQSAHNNGYVGMEKEDGSIVRLDALLKRYDENAKRLGFSQAEDGNWYRQVEHGMEFVCGGDGLYHAKKAS